MFEIFELNGTDRQRQQQCSGKLNSIWQLHNHQRQYHQNITILTSNSINRIKYAFAKIKQNSSNFIEN
ncbi:hypothetical protein DERP_002699 [Dermatophagoides pteronyssinus]|uniref:Uncharacterized protein n=1 Tax=Dermatophagoides pteronyssinus TaxID=6956 RepID=A0ABQ8JVU7_DERPT|nr:hypothetical protein DERP_002699 [Dermatophagoides pteronyssinus]